MQNIFDKSCTSRATEERDTPPHTLSFSTVDMMCILHADGIYGPLVHSHTEREISYEGRARSLAHTKHTHSQAEVEHQKGIFHCKFGCGARLNCILHGYVRRILKVT